MPIRTLEPSERARLSAALAAEGLPTGDLDAPGRLFFSYDGGGTRGYGGLEIYGTEALLRSVVVPAPARANGLGTALVRDLIAHARELGVARVWLLTQTAPEFFAKLGFERTDRAAAPAAIASTAEFAGLCPASAVCMTREIRPPPSSDPR